jgi:hypothetical protein
VITPLSRLAALRAAPLAYADREILLESLGPSQAPVSLRARHPEPTDADELPAVGAEFAFLTRAARQCSSPHPYGWMFNSWENDATRVAASE